MWVGPTPVPNAAKAWHTITMAYGYQSLSFDRHNPTTAIGQLEYTIPSPPIHVHVYVSMQRGNTWVAKRSISYNVYSYILRRHTRHPVELLCSEQCAIVDKDVLTLASGRNILIVVVVGFVLRRKLLDCVIDRRMRPTWIWKKLRKTWLKFTNFSAKFDRANFSLVIEKRITAFEISLFDREFWYNWTLEYEL